MLNLLGTIFSNQMITQIMLAWWLLVVDCVLMIQFLYYKKKNNISSDLTPLLNEETFLQVSALLPTIFKLDKLGLIAGWLSSIFYISSRIPQIFHNVKYI